MSRWTRRGGGKKKERYTNLLIDLETGEVSRTSVGISIDAGRRYLEAHYTLLPEGVKTWSAEQLEHKVEVARVSGATRDWERALLVLAHHRSELACDRLLEIAPQVPEELRGFHQLALGEALGWLGYDYVVDEAGRPRVLPAGASWPCSWSEGAAN